jgi:hypothetical protein
MRISMACEPGSNQVENEDWAGVTPDTIVVLDGVTVRRDMETGCAHGTPWYVRQLGSRLLAALTQEPRCQLPTALAEAIRAVAALHNDTCDLDSIGSPSAAVAILRAADGLAEYLVLADVTIALTSMDGTKIITDDRVATTVADLTAGTAGLSARITEARTANRNRPGGYWVAAANPVAAANGITGSIPFKALLRAAVMTDGASRIADLFSYATWPDLMKNHHSAREVIRAVRLIEASDPDCVSWPRFKRSDDATAVFCDFRDELDAADTPVTYSMGGLVGADAALQPENCDG